MTKTARKSRLNPAPATTKPRAVYEVRPVQGQPQRLEATTAAELAESLRRALKLDEYDARAAAQVLHVQRASIAAPNWQARRLGVLEFKPDPAPVTARSTPAIHEAPATGDPLAREDGSA